MSTARFSKSAIAAAVILVAIAAADSNVPAASTVPGPDVLQVRNDAPRGRVWTLSAEGVDLYDARTQARLRSIALPEWIWVNTSHACPPDLAIGPKGDVFVSSNVVPVIWRIDGANFQVSRHELEVSEDKGRDVGFSGLRYLPQHGAYAAVNGLDGSLWRIDASLRRAEQIPLSEPIFKGDQSCAIS